MPTIFVRAAKGRRAFATPKGPEIPGGDYRGIRDTPFVRRQIENGDLEEKQGASKKSEEKPVADKPGADETPANEPQKTPPAPDAPRAPDALKKG